MAENYGTKIERKLMAHYINVSGSAAAEWERLGKDLEELNIELNADAEDKKNILGETNVLISAYAATASAEPYYARQGTKLFEKLQEIVDGRLVLDDLAIETLEVHLWDGTSGSYKAIKEVAYLEVTSYGGDTTGYQIPFTLHYTGERVSGTFDIDTKTFTETGA